MRYRVRHVTEYSYSEPVPICHNRVHLAPRDLPFQSCLRYDLEVRPTPSTAACRTDYFGNPTDYFSILEAHQELRITSDSIVDVFSRKMRKQLPDIPWEEVAAGLHTDLTGSGLEALHFSLPSQRIVPSEELREYAAESFAKRRPIIDAARELASRIHADFVFDPRATTVATSPQDLLVLRRGVCQDFAHLAIACLRSLGLSACYVSGYVCTTPPPSKPRLQGADASHAWISVFCGAAGWIDLDPTNDLVVDDTHVTIAWGRDYSDVGPIQGVFVGGGEHTMNVGVDVVPS